jgi:hypothetical protein
MIISITLIAFLVTTLNPSVTQTNPRAEIPTVAFCDLIRNPARDDDKVIRVKAILMENQTPRVDGGDPIFYDVGCRKNDFSVVVESSEPFDETAPVYKALARIRKKPDKRGNTRASSPSWVNSMPPANASMVILIGLTLNS